MTRPSGCRKEISRSDASPRFPIAPVVLVRSLFCKRRDRLDLQACRLGDRIECHPAAQGGTGEEAVDGPVEQRVTQSLGLFLAEVAQRPLILVAAP